VFDRLAKTAAGFMAVSILATAAWAQAAAPKQPQVKDQGEFDIYNQCVNEKDQQKKLDCLKTWEQKYPDSDFKNQRKLMQAQAYQQIALAAYGKTDPAVLDSGQKAAQAIIDNLDNYFAAENKPANVSDADWQNARHTFELQANTIAGYVAMQKKDDATAEAAFKKVLQLDANSAQVSYWLGTVILRQRKVERMPEALYQIARAVDVTGNEALPAAGKKAAEDYLAKAYAGYHGSPDGLDDVKKQAQQAALMPSGFAIKSIVDIQKEQEGNEEEFRKAHPDVGLWRTIRDTLKSDGGDKYFADGLKDSQVPPEGQAGFTMFSAKVLQQNGPKELLVNVDSPAGDATLQFEDPLKGTIEPGTQIKFKGVVASYVKDPYMITFTGLGKEDVEGLPASAFATTPTKRPPAKKKKKE
jgi:hypothetical protein